MSVESEIIVVSGLPRSGTSLMMQMLARAGIPTLTDNVRIADADNPRGYFEFERVKTTKHDPTWIPEARGKAVKIVSPLLYDLPDRESYRVLFMERDIDEVLQSQERMLRRLKRSGGPSGHMKTYFAIHLERLFRWLPAQRHMQVLNVSYNQLLAKPGPELQKVSDHLDGRPAPELMLQAIDSSLYRNRHGC